MKRLAGNAAAISSTAPPAPQPMSTTVAPWVSLSTTPSSAGSTTGNRNVRFHGSKLRSMPDRALRSVAVVVVAEAGAEALRHPFERLHGLREPMEHPHPERRVFRRGQHGRRLRRQREPHLVARTARSDGSAR